MDCLGLDMKGIKVTRESFIERSRNIHKNKYDYSKVEYINLTTKVYIICPIHGGFWQRPKDHLSGQGCKQCFYEKSQKEQSLTKETFIEKAQAIHGDKYDYSKVKYVNNHTKVCIICPEHGEFWQLPNNHIKGRGCRLCGLQSVSIKMSSNKDEFIKKAKKVHGDKYDYSLVEYKPEAKIAIICPIHGVFNQRVSSHLLGNGCPTCNDSKGERVIFDYLKRNNIGFISQYKIPNEYLFCDNKMLYVDFYIPNKNIFIEYNGEQHYSPYKHFGGVTRYKKQKARDESLRQYCIKHNINLIEISYKDFDKIELILNNEIKDGKKKKTKKKR